MITLLFIIFLIGLIGVRIFKYKNKDKYIDYDTVFSPFASLIFVLSFMCIVLFFAEMTYISDLIDIPVIENKIIMYTEENEKIEKEISAIVENYMDHEKYVFDKNISIPALISLYPELKSDSLVQNQIKIYQNNNNQIKSLKTKLIELQKSKFMVYFGKY